MSSIITSTARISRLKEIIQLFLGVGLLYASTQVKIPWGIVPITLQTTAALLIGLTYSPRLAMATVALYLSIGAVGVNVFTTPGALWGPTGGYLVGFFLCASTLSLIKQRVGKMTAVRLIALSLLGLGLIYGTGLARLAMLIGIPEALQAGLFPFVIPELLKSALLVAFLRTAQLNLKFFGK